ncbi:cytochrome c oxidase assembly protein [Nonomuraea sp. NPDC049709]|uniref:cytochrome c oxidase assembly protein n=1 Tax=Nonomuraea sp. NPDC049709 TaxID=3154736 RepID=UPI003430ADA9
MATHGKPGRWRAAAFLTGVALLAAATTGPIAVLAATDFRGHTLQHLLIGMPAPLRLDARRP